MRKPLVIDLFCGLGGWTHGFLAEGWDCYGFDIEQHLYGEKRYPAQLVLQDVLTLDGKQFRGIASMIVASPPCQEYSYMAMPWKRGKQIAAALRGQGYFPEGYTGSRTVEQLNALFNAALRIAREAELPIVIENVNGAQPWVGRAKANFGSYYLWGDVARIGNRVVRDCVPVFGMDAVAACARRKPEALVESFNGHDDPRRGRDTVNGSWFAVGSNGKSNLKRDGIKNGSDTRNEKYRLTTPDPLVGVRSDEGVKQGGEWWHDPQSITWRHGSRSSARKAASAMIAEIPLDLARHIARVFHP